MEREIYITETEHAKCKSVADAFEELYEESDIVVLDAGRYGFVELQYFRAKSGFNSNNESSLLLRRALMLAKHKFSGGSLKRI